MRTLSKLSFLQWRNTIYQGVLLQSVYGQLPRRSWSTIGCQYSPQSLSSAATRIHHELPPRSRSIRLIDWLMVCQRGFCWLPQSEGELSGCLSRRSYSDKNDAERRVQPNHSPGRETELVDNPEKPQKGTYMWPRWLNNGHIQFQVEGLNAMMQRRAD